MTAWSVRTPGNLDDHRFRAVGVGNPTRAPVWPQSMAIRGRGLVASDIGGPVPRPWKFGGRFSKVAVMASVRSSLGRKAAFQAAT